MEAWLLVVTSHTLARGERIRLTPGEDIVLGRIHDAAIKLVEECAGRRHARIRGDESTGQWRCEDFGSTNGTAINGDRIRDAVLRDGDSLSLGVTIFSFFEGPDAEARANAAAAELARAERFDVRVGPDGLDDALAHAVYEATVHRRPLTLLILEWRRLDPIGLLRIASARFGPALRIGLRVAVILESDAEIAPIPHVHIGVARLVRPDDHPGPYDTHEPRWRMIAAAREALASGNAVAVAPPVVLRPA